MTVAPGAADVGLTAMARVRASAVEKAGSLAKMNVETIAPKITRRTKVAVVMKKLSTRPGPRRVVRVTMSALAWVGVPRRNELPALGMIPPSDDDKRRCVLVGNDGGVKTVWV